MKILIDNYSSNLSTEPLYFNECINRAGGESRIWNRSQLSVYDQFDSYQPDVFICHFSQVNDDIIKYLSNNRSIELVMNVTGATQETLDNISSQLKNLVNCKLLFTNTPPEVLAIAEREIKTINILPGVDTFQQPRGAVLFSIGTGVISCQPTETLKELTKSLDTYHLLTPHNVEGYDATVDIPTLVDIYDKYEKIILFDPIQIVLSQVFFESVYRANQISIQVGVQESPKLDKFIETLFHIQEGDIGQVVKEQIAAKHTCWNRTSRLVKHLGDEALSNQIIRTRTDA